MYCDVTTVVVRTDGSATCILSSIRHSERRKGENISFGSNLHCPSVVVLGPLVGYRGAKTVSCKNPACE